MYSVCNVTAIFIQVINISTEDSGKSDFALMLVPLLDIYKGCSEGFIFFCVLFMFKFILQYFCDYICIIINIHFRSLGSQAVMEVELTTTTRWNKW